MVRLRSLRRAMAGRGEWLKVPPESPIEAFGRSQGADASALAEGSGFHLIRDNSSARLAVLFRFVRGDGNCRPRLLPPMKIERKPEQNYGESD